MGDRVLRTVADAINHCIRKTDKLVRYGGDEFVMTISNCNEETGEKMKGKINAALKRANEIGDFPYEVSSSICYSCAHPGEKNTLEESVKIADDLMYREKKKRRKLKK